MLLTRYNLKQPAKYLWAVHLAGHAFHHGHEVIGSAEILCIVSLLRIAEQQECDLLGCLLA